MANRSETVAALGGEQYEHRTTNLLFETCCSNATSLYLHQSILLALGLFFQTGISLAATYTFVFLAKPGAITLAYALIVGVNNGFLNSFLFTATLQGFFQVMLHTNLRLRSAKWLQAAGP